MSRASDLMKITMKWTSNNERSLYSSDYHIKRLNVASQSYCHVYREKCIWPSHIHFIEWNWEDKILSQSKERPLSNEYKKGFMV